MEAAARSRSVPRGQEFPPLCVPVCVCVGGRAVRARVLVHVWGAVCDPLREEGAAPSWAPSCNNWFHSFMPSLLTSISSVSAGLVPGPALGAEASLGPGTHPLLPWRNSQSREETDQEKQKAIPSRKWIWWKTLDLAGTLSLGVVLPAM